MHKLVVLYPPPVDPEEFARYYRSTHLPLAMRLPGALGMRYSLSIHGADEESPYFAIFETDFASAEDLGAAMASPEGLAVQADVRNYATGGAIVLDYSVED